MWHILEILDKMYIKLLAEIIIHPILGFIGISLFYYFICIKCIEEQKSRDYMFCLLAAFLIFFYPMLAVIIDMLVDYGFSEPFSVVIVTILYLLHIYFIIELTLISSSRGKKSTFHKRSVLVFCVPSSDVSFNCSMLELFIYSIALFIIIWVVINLLYIIYSRFIHRSNVIKYSSSELESGSPESESSPSSPSLPGGGGSKDPEDEKKRKIKRYAIFFSKILVGCMLIYYYNANVSLQELFNLLQYSINLKSDSTLPGSMFLDGDNLYASLKASCASPLPDGDAPDYKPFTIDQIDGCYNNMYNYLSSIHTKIGDNKFTASYYSELHYRTVKGILVKVSIYQCELKHYENFPQHVYEKGELIKKLCNEYIKYYDFVMERIKYE